MTKQRPLRLGLALVPEPLWGVNLRSALGKHGWEKIRRALLEQQGPTCATCGIPAQPPVGHEVWDYPTGKAVLRRVEFICQMCNSVHHLGRLNVLVSRGELDPMEIEKAIAHFVKVNGCTRADFKRHWDESIAEWNRLSKKRWPPPDWGPFTELVNEAAPDKSRGGQAARACGGSLPPRGRDGRRHCVSWRVGFAWSSTVIATRKPGQWRRQILAEIEGGSDAKDPRHP